MHEMAWVTTQGQAVGWVKLAARVDAHGNDVMDLQAAPTLSACPARGMAGQVLRSNSGPLAGSPDFGGLEQSSDKRKHRHSHSPALFLFVSPLTHAPPVFALIAPGTHTPESLAQMRFGGVSMG